MAKSEQFHAPRGGGRLLRRTTAGLVVVVLVAAGASYQLDLGQRLGVAAPDPATEPAAVEPPPGLELPVAAPASAVAAETASAPADPAAVTAALGSLPLARKLGRRVTVAVSQPAATGTLYTSGVSLVTPASTLKLLTGLAALDVLGPDHRFSTTVVRAGRRIVLVGGGDPLLDRSKGRKNAYPQHADLTTLARQTARALAAAGVTRVRLGYDTSLFTGPAVEPTWESDYIPDNVVSPISSLWVDEGRERPGLSGRSLDPALAAAQVFATALGQSGITVAGAPRAQAPRAGMTQVAAVQSAPLSQIVQHVLEVSDNEGAEVLMRHVGIAQSGEGSFVAGAAAVRAVLTKLGIGLAGAVIHDGSGLSRDDRLSAGTLLDVLRVASGDPRLRTVVSGLPVAGFSGSLAVRFETAPRDALGEVRAKTGTLTGVTGLAGTVVTRDGVPLTFVAIADKVSNVNTLFARAQLDKIAGALAACTCGLRSTP